MVPKICLKFLYFEIQFFQMNTNEEITKTKVVDLEERDYIYIFKNVQISYFSKLKRNIYELERFTYYSIIFKKYIYNKTTFETRTNLLLITQP